MVTCLAGLALFGVHLLAISAPEPATAPVLTARAAAQRLLTQATFGPSDTDTAELLAQGAEQWVATQLTKPLDGLARQHVERAALVHKVGQGDVMNALWEQMLTSQAQLRQRLAFAWSEIFVISLVDGGVHSEPRAAAAYYDMLAQKGVGNFRELLEAVALHPMMGKYLSHLGSQKANAATGRVPDENFAREIMQLFTIGLVQLNADGTVKRDAGGRALETYGPDDVAGLAKVFTGFSWGCPAFPADRCFLAGSPRNLGDADAGFKPMMGYPQFHSTEEKRFLGVTIAAQSTADPKASVKVALDTLFNHPNVGPFIGRQLIQRLVTSNPSPQYVAAVTAAFNDNGAGVRGDMGAVVKAILLHPEARTPGASAGKLREPVLRLTAFIRAFPSRSVSGDWRVGGTSDAALQLAQTPLSAPSVFNFFRPGYAPAGTQTAAQGLVAPEMQLVNDTTLAGYGRFMRAAVERGVGVNDGAGVPDVQFDMTAELALAERPGLLMERLNRRLVYSALPAASVADMVANIGRLEVPALNPDGSNQAAVSAAKRKRVQAALLLTLMSNDFLVQK